MKTISCRWIVNNLCILFIHQFLLPPAQSQNFTATYSSVKLPTPDYYHRAWYNGQDDIYLFGGSGGGTSENAKKILRYSLSKDSITWERSLPVSARFGSLHSDLDGNVFYFGAEYYKDDKILRYSPSSNSSSVVATLPHNICGIPTIKLDDGRVLILGQWEDEGREIYSFDLTRCTITLLEVQTLPNPNTTEEFPKKT